MSATLDENCFTSGHLAENIDKNRYPDIVPVDTYRAYLSTPVKGSNEYINAVFMPVSMKMSQRTTTLTYKTREESVWSESSLIACGFYSF